MDILELINSSHSLAKSKGFWDEKKNQKEDIMLIISNLGEIVKSYKRHKFADWILYNEQLNKQVEFTNSAEYFNVFIKDTFEDEVANVIIRITDFFGGNNIDILSDKEWLRSATSMTLPDFFRFTAPSEEYCGNVGEWLERAISEKCFHADESDKGLLHILFYLGTIIEEFHIDIERHIKAKLKYNLKRPQLYNRLY